MPRGRIKLPLVCSPCMVQHPHASHRTERSYEGFPLFHFFMMNITLIRDPEIVAKSPRAAKVVSYHDTAPCCATLLWTVR